jgi:hypothetical protein
MTSLANSVIWCQHTLGLQLSLATCQSCRDQRAALEHRRTYDFLTRLHDEFDPLRALARHHCDYLMDALAQVHNEETSLRDTGLLWSSSILVARLIAPMSPASPLTAPSCCSW